MLSIFVRQSNKHSTLDTQCTMSTIIKTNAKSQSPVFHPEMISILDSDPFNFHNTLFLRLHLTAFIFHIFILNLSIYLPLSPSLSLPLLNISTHTTLYIYVLRKQVVKSFITLFSFNSLHFG